jgi:hydrogenase maturation protease
MRKEIALIGLGNTLFGDEGVGIYALRELEKICHFPHIECIDGHTLGFGLLHVCEGRRKIIVIDGGICGVKPGCFRRFRKEDIESRKDLRGFSLHEFDLFMLLEIADEMGMFSHTDVVIYCMEIEYMGASDSLSTTVKKGLPLLIKAVYDEVMAYTGSNSINTAMRK